jgi:hypothetical protein
MPMSLRLAPLAFLAALAACGPPQPVDPLEAARRCEDRARGAAGPTGAVVAGASTSDGPFLGTSISLSGDFLRGRDPAEVYEQCVIDLTGAPPVRPAAL